VAGHLARDKAMPSACRVSRPAMWARYAAFVGASLGHAATRASAAAVFNTASDGA